MDVEEDVRRNVSQVLERVQDAARGRPVVVVAATKTQPPHLVRAAVAAGIRDIGENRVQEAADKKDELGDLEVRWHMIGRLQRNKVKAAVSLFDLIQSVDSLAIAAAIEREASARGIVMPVLVEVNIGMENTKGGIDPAGAATFVEQLGEFPHLRVEGLMAVPPASPDPESSRPFFRRMRKLQSEIASRGFEHAPARILSMGMSADYVVAIEEGATMVRIGTAIFGPRAGR